MAYDVQQIQEMEDSLEDCIEKLQSLLIAYASRNYRTERGRELAVHGFSRRIKTVEYGIRTVFDILPLHEENPSIQSLNTANCIIQSIMINVFGALENLSQIWVHESDVRGKKGNLLSGRQIGLSPNHSQFRSSLPDDLNEYVSNLAEWYDYLSQYRHALAHRIPPYLVPRTFSDIDAKEYRKVDAEMLAALKNYDFDQHLQLSRHQDSIGSYSALMMHSYSEGAVPIFFHPQLICDALTIHQAGERFLLYLPNCPRY
ncbi:hypothetical protein [Aurantiacibacter xanthus]|uniref:hypothetical protein n=1 Tax=Aurantiacibacter xanthus TaxID=1784712 RepID=UPI0011C2261F|nr:hypothetical protein [Aurantiacibacter xanthus]